MTHSQEGGSHFSQELVRIRNAAGSMRYALEKLSDNSSSPHTMAILETRMALQLTVVLEAVSELEHIGQAAKSERRKA